MGLRMSNVLNEHYRENILLYNQRMGQVHQAVVEDLDRRYIALGDNIVTHINTNMSSGIAEQVTAGIGKTILEQIQTFSSHILVRLKKLWVHTKQMETDFHLHQNEVIERLTTIETKLPNFNPSNGTIFYAPYDFIPISHPIPSVHEHLVFDSITLSICGLTFIVFISYFLFRCFRGSFS